MKRAPDRLAEYRHKRDFAATPEPPARSTRGRGARYIVHLHHARRRHFDLRLQVGNTLRSWAVPKGPSLDPDNKRLAVEVEDHPLDYGDFEGVIPQGHYGAGEVWIWDRGEWLPEGDARQALEQGHLRFELRGTRLHGAWSLVRTQLRGTQPQWLLIKSHDAAERAGDVADDTPLSQWQAGAEAPALAAAGSAAKAAVQPPQRIGLQLARLAGRAPPGADWLHEVKFDGYRVLLWRDGRTVRITSRGDQDWSRKLAAAAAAVRKLPCRSCVLDGELVALDAQGRSSFGRLQQAFGESAAQESLRVMLFDLLFLDGADLRGRAQMLRKEALARLLAKPPPPLYNSGYLVGNGPQAAREACAQGLEGIVCKALDAPYSAGRGGAWLKVKCVQSDEYAVIGYTTGKGARAKLGALLLAEPGTAGHWRYRGRVGTGLDEPTIADLLDRLSPAAHPPALDQPPQRAQLRGAKPVWVEPELVVEVAYRGYTEDGLLRQASLKGLREDRSVGSLRPARRDAAEVAPVPEVPKPPGSRRRSAAAAAAQAPRLTHPERLLFEDPPISKRELAQFYTDIAGHILPGLVNRPLLLLRCPEGSAGACFFQKHLSPGFPPAVREMEDPEAGQRWIYIEDLDGLLGLVQMNAVEYHVWGAKAAQLDRADRLVLDLDPAADVPWKQVVEAALELRTRLQAVGLESFVRTSGGKGLHVVVPLQPAADWDSARSFSHALARAMEQDHPQHYLAVATKSRRAGKVFVDYLRNGRGATAVCSYSLRHRPGVPIATPLSWDELPRLRAPDQFNYANIGRRLARARDPWEGLERLRQALRRLRS